MDGEAVPASKGSHFQKEVLPHFFLLCRNMTFENIAKCIGIKNSHFSCSLGPVGLVVDGVGLGRQLHAGWSPFYFFFVFDIDN